ncbi:hypothetical protein OG859_06355 [Streptomyces sp. NBC_00048]
MPWAGDTGVVVRAAHGAQLAFGSGCQRSGRRAVVGRADALDHRVDAVAVGECVGERPYDDGTGAFAEDEAVGPFVERTAHPGGGQRAEPGEADQAVGGEVEVHAAHDGDPAGALAQLCDRLVEGDQGAGTGGVDGEAGAAEVELAADGAGRHVEEAPGQAEGMEGAEPLRLLLDGVQAAGVVRRLRLLGQGHGPEGGRHEVLVVGHRNPEEDPGVLPVEVAAAQPRVVEGLAGDVEHQPVLRVHGLGAGGRHPVVHGVEAVHVVQEGDLVGVRGMGGRRVAGLVEGLVVPACRRDGGELPFSAQQEVPVGADVGGAGEAAAESGDGDVGHEESSLVAMARAGSSRGAGTGQAPWWSAARGVGGWK